MAPVDGWQTVSPEDAKDGAMLVEVDDLLRVLQDQGKSPGGATTVLLLAIAHLLSVSKVPDARREMAIDMTPRILREMVDSLRRLSADQEPRH